MAIPPVLFFELYQNGQLIRSAQSAQTAIKIGSHAKSHLHVEDPEVGRVHAVVEKSAQGIFIIDLGSGRGTFVNGERVNKKQLQHRDRIKLGTTEIVLLTHDEKAVASAARRRKHAIDPRTNRPRDEVLYSRRFLAKPANTDGAVEIAMLYHDHVMAEELYRPPRNVTIGDSKSADFIVSHKSFEGSFTLLDSSGGEPTLNFASGMEGELYIGSKRFTLEEAIQSGKAKRNGNVASVALTEETRAKIVLDDIKFFVHRSTRPAVVLPTQKGAAAPLLFLLFSAGLHALLLLLVMFLPPGIGGLSLDSFGAQDRFVQILIQDAEPEAEPEDEELGEEDGDDGEEEEEEQLADGEEGRAGTEEAEEADARMAIEGDLPEGEMELARQDAMEAVQDRGALAVLNQAPAGPASLFGGAAAGYDAVTAIGAVQGDSVGASYGTRGLGAYGGGLSGGGRHTGRALGAGSMALGRSGGGGDGGRRGTMTSISGREARTPTVVMERPDISGQLDREIIQRVIREHRREVRACYEGELQRNPDLEGRVVVGFVISSDGQVAGSRIAESTLGNSTVEDCVARRVRQWRFPEPRGGGTVNVNYPFVFSPGG